MVMQIYTNTQNNPNRLIDLIGRRFQGIGYMTLKGRHIFMNRIQMRKKWAGITCVLTN